MIAAPRETRPPLSLVPPGKQGSERGDQGKAQGRFLSVCSISRNIACGAGSSTRRGLRRLEGRVIDWNGGLVLMDKTETCERACPKERGWQGVFGDSSLR